MKIFQADYFVPGLGVTAKYFFTTRAKADAFVAAAEAEARKMQVRNETDNGFWTVKEFEVVE